MNLLFRYSAKNMNLSFKCAILEIDVILFKNITATISNSDQETLQKMPRACISYLDSELQKNQWSNLHFS